MALIEYNIFGEKRDKVQTAIDRLRAFESKDGYYVADSGGKDSSCVVKLCEMAGVKFDAHYHATTVDPPQLVRFIRQYHPQTEIEKPEYTMRELIVKKQMPPTRLMRYCCQLRLYNVPYCELYDCGFKRLGCVACPLGGSASMQRELEFSHNSSHSIFAPLMRCWTHGEKRENPSIGIGRTANRSCAGG